ncbi:aminoglycoside phosphotransferase family protein [Roseibium marinum]|uniref:Aminoglycoside phosphotransferase (APT) family kinase protein n=1 Tax=Roseibium marinum TaxID=281252 RepID=A0A2S3UQR8_9HYPH|nr:aminoglycoside phosphotransferase family protein [Roseibium marinum]POF30024.1 aminoglycoside phosphotransferase (APT) family kinase protein [Roseibium marinum]
MEIDEHTVAQLIHQQFPHLSRLPIAQVKKQGWDNRTFKLGDALSVRLPSNASYADAVRKEADVLMTLAKHLRVEVPEVVAVGAPSEEFPLPWSIRRWVEGDTLENTQGVEQDAFAISLGNTLADLRAIKTSRGPYAGRHSFFRGCHPSVYGDEVQKSLEILESKVDAARCLDIWQRCITSAWKDKPVWFHGDVAVGNIIVENSTVKALIDFGTCGIGDPACDFAMAWTYFDVESRGIFRSACAIDGDTWQRARGWALWKALVCLSGLSNPDTDGTQARALQEICDEEE